MQNINQYEHQLNNELSILINEYTELQKKIVEEEFSFELKRKNFFENVMSEVGTDIIKAKSDLIPLKENIVNINEEYIKKTIKQILKI
jgi:hypothetical protein